jgi:hypothetical protein
LYLNHTIDEYEHDIKHDMVRASFVELQELIVHELLSQNRRRQALAWGIMSMGATRQCSTDVSNHKQINVKYESVSI